MWVSSRGLRRWIPFRLLECGDGRKSLWGWYEKRGRTDKVGKGKDVETLVLVGRSGVFVSQSLFWTEIVCPRNYHHRIPGEWQQ